MSAHSESERPDSAPFPAQLGRYEVLLPIARGGMATVFLARTLGPGGFERQVALKITHAHLQQDPEFVASLVDEARLAGRIRHRNVVSVLDVGDDAYGAFIVMEYVEGESLATVLQLLRDSDQRMPLPVVLRVLDDVLGGLHAAHELTGEGGAPLQVVHRDVTPHNILLGVDGVAKLTDFGIAKAARRLAKTRTGFVKGKTAYMAPEQAQGLAIDRRVDVWAAGVLAWEAISGSRLFEGPSDAAILLKLVREPAMRLRALRPDVPASIDAAVASALERDVAARCPPAAAFSESLKAAARGAGISKAEPEDVARFLQPLLAARLAARREKQHEIRALRERVGALVQASAAGQSAPTLPQLSVPRPRSRSSWPPPEAPKRSGVPPSARHAAPSREVTEVLDAPVRGSMPDAESLEELVRSIPPPSRRSTWWIAVAVAGAVLLIGGALLAFGPR